MIYGQDFGSRWALLPVSWAGILCCYLLLRKLMRLDESNEKEEIAGKIHCLRVLSGCVGSGILVWRLCAEKMVFFFPFCIVAACLLGACVMDVETRVVYNYVWWISGTAGAVAMLLSGNNQWVPVLLFILLQELFFAKMYGRADCHGFAVCALAEGAFGMGLKEYLLHMLLAFFLLGVVQFLKHNVGKNGNLKNPVPFLPYITSAFWINLTVYFLF